MFPKEPALALRPNCSLNVIENISNLKSYVHYAIKFVWTGHSFDGNTSVTKEFLVHLLFII